MVTKKQFLGQIYFPSSQHLNIIVMFKFVTKRILKCYKYNKCDKTFSKHIFYEYIKELILDRNTVHKQCVKAFACNCSLRNRL